MSLCRILTIIILIFVNTSIVQAKSVAEYLPGDHIYNVDVPTPGKSLGFELGQRHPRHDQVLAYLQTLALSSERVKLTEIGLTTELRKQVLLTISHPDNLANLEHILQQRKITSFGTKTTEEQKAEEPLVVWLGYSIHGDEISGTNAAMAVAYHFAASQNKALEELLKNTIIVIEPSLNPDGMDRFVNWVNTYRGTTVNSDPNHIEHHQGWQKGRTNHFGFDLNRDWLLLAQKETQHRLKYFHHYQPNVLGDFHEMKGNGSYFFQPGIPSRTHPLTPAKNIELTRLLAGYHAAALDKEQRLYYTEESYDDFFYGKGSTYPDINGGVGILFEQASSRGLQQETVNGLLTFEFGIKNHVLTSLSTVNGAWDNREQLKEYRRDFYKQAEKQAKKEKVSGYLLTERYDKYRLNAFLNKLRQHQIRVYHLTEDFRHNSKLFNKSDSYFVPLLQPQYRVIKALFNQETEFKDNTFYDVSGWTMPLAMDIEFHEVSRTWGLKLDSSPWQLSVESTAKINEGAYAYIFDWHHFMAPKLLNQLLSQNIKVKVATKSFSTIISGKNRHFSAGAIVILAGIQNENNWQQILSELSINAQVELTAVSSGLTSKGIDLGSGSLRIIEPVNVLLLGGKYVSQNEAGEIVFYLDDTLNIPVSVIDMARLGHTDLNRYSHIIMVDGNYSSVSTAVVSKLEQWIEQGGVVFSQKRAAKWLSERGMLKANFVSESQIDGLFDTEKLQYRDKGRLSARKRIAGAIFETELDIGHPLTYGYNKASLPVFRNSTLIMNKPSEPFITVAKYSSSPLMSGYADRNLVNLIANNPTIIAHNLKKGRVIASSDNLTFRGYWYGSAKILANSIFFAKAFSAPVKD